MPETVSTPNTAAATAAPSAALRALAALSTAIWWASVALLVSLVLIGFALYGWLVPQVGQLRPMLESRLSQGAGVNVRIGSLQARWQGWMPILELHQVRLLDAQAREALALNKVQVAVSPHSILRLGVEQILIEQPELAIRRDAKGRISIAGLNMPQNQEASSEPSIASDWLFSQRELVIRGGTIRWTDELLAAPPLALDRLDLYLRNSGRKHLMRLSATPPAQWGQRFTLLGDVSSPLLSAHPGDWRAWEGQFYADFPHVDVASLKKHAKLSIDVQHGQGALRAWLALAQGRATEGTLDAALHNVDLRLRPDLPMLDMRQLNGRLMGSDTPERYRFASENLAFELQGGFKWPGGNVHFEQSHAANPAAAQGQFKADQLDLAALAHISDRLPLDAALHRWQQSLRPQGLVKNLSAAWSGQYSAPSRYQVNGSVHQLKVQPSAAPSTVAVSKTSAAQSLWHPGVQGLDVDFNWNEAKGQAKLRLKQGSISLPGLLEEPQIALEQMTGDVDWQFINGRWQVQVPALELDNADAQVKLQANWHPADISKNSTRSAFPGVIDLQGKLLRLDGSKIYRYLPQGIAPNARQYVKEAIVRAKASDVAVRIKGDLYDLPFTDPSKGEFRFAGRLDEGAFDYLPKRLQSAKSLPWPSLLSVQGDWVFDRTALTVKASSSKLAGLPQLQLGKTEASITQLNASPQIELSTEGRGASEQWLALVNTTPVAQMLNQALARASASGSNDVRLRLSLPLQDLERSKVLGSVTFAGTDFQFSPDSPALQQGKGVLTFTDKGFALRDIQAKLYGGDVRLEGGSRVVAASSNEPSLVFRAQGSASALGLRQAGELGIVSRLAQAATGSANYNAVLGFRKGNPEITVTSDLLGMGLNLPAPLQKAPTTTLALRYDNLLTADSLAEGAKLQDFIGLDLAGLGSVQYWRDISGELPRVLRGRIGIGLAPGQAIAANEGAGVAASINFKRVDLDAWEKLLTNLSARAENAPPRTASASLSADTLAYLPSSMSIRADELIVQGRSLHDIVIGGSREGQTWRANLDASELNGYVEYRQASAGNAGRVYARLARLSLAEQAVRDIESALEQPPTSIPALDVMVDDLQMRGKSLGRVELEAQNRLDSVTAAREWRLSKLNVIMPEAQLSATGNWAAVGASTNANRVGRVQSEARRRTALSFKLDIANSGDLLKRFGQDKVIARGKGSMQGQVAWLGAPWALDYPSMTGGFNVNIEAGQFLKADPGIAKLLGVLSLQALPRRLTLDFRDVFSQGFAFDFIRGDVKIEQGLATTNNLQMKGVNAAVLMEGSANIERETQDLKVVVVPEINAGTASLIATVINPVVGLSSFLAQWILRRPVIEANTQEFHIEGSWQDPQVSKVKNKPLEVPRAADSTNP